MLLLCGLAAAAVAAVAYFLLGLRSYALHLPRPLPPKPTGIRVAVVGAGLSGLVMLRELLAAGHDAVIFEASSLIGGVFAATYDECLLTSSSINTAFSSFFPTGEPHVHWTASQYVDYLLRFVEHFGLRPRIHLRSRVLSLRSEASPSGGQERWEVTVRKSSSDDDDDDDDDDEGAVTETSIFDHVAVCTGVHAFYDLPHFEGQDVFRGQIIHTAEYKRASELSGQRVLVVGLGESGSDIALAVSKVASATALSTQEGPGYVIPRTLMGAPTDMDTNRVYHSIPRWIWASRLIAGKKWMETVLARWRPGEQDDFEVLRRASSINAKRGKSAMQRFGTKTACFVEAMVHHGALYKPRIVRLNEDGAVFADGSAFECDVIICATGYKVDLPWLPPEVNAVACRPRQLYKHTFIPTYGARIAFAGFARPNLGAIPPLAEMQSRWFAQVISGAIALPSAKEMKAAAAADDARTLAQFSSDAERIGALTDYLTLLDDLAERVGCTPPLRRLALTEPTTWLKVMCGPLSGPQFRLVGPGAAPAEARAALALLPTMPALVLCFEVAVLLACKVLCALGLAQFRPVGLCGGGGKEAKK